MLYLKWRSSFLSPSTCINKGPCNLNSSHKSKWKEQTLGTVCVKLRELLHLLSYINVCFISINLFVLLSLGELQCFFGHIKPTQSQQILNNKYPTRLYEEVATTTNLPTQIKEEITTIATMLKHSSCWVKQTEGGKKSRTNSQGKSHYLFGQCILFGRPVQHDLCDALFRGHHHCFVSSLFPLCFRLPLARGVRRRTQTRHQIHIVLPSSFLRRRWQIASILSQ